MQVVPWCGPTFGGKRAHLGSRIPQQFRNHLTPSLGNWHLLPTILPWRRLKGQSARRLRNASSQGTRLNFFLCASCPEKEKGQSICCPHCTSARMHGVVLGLAAWQSRKDADNARKGLALRIIQAQRSAERKAKAAQQPLALFQKERHMRASTHAHKLQTTVAITKPSNAPRKCTASHSLRIDEDAVR